MPLRPRINTLPATVRAQLDRKLKAADYGSLVEIAAWLRSKGYPIQKSAVGAYSKRLQAGTRQKPPPPPAQEYIETCRQWAELVQRSPPAAPSAAGLRLACLQSAARSPGSTAAVLKRAEAFAAWVKTGKAPGAGK